MTRRAAAHRRKGYQQMDRPPVVVKNLLEQLRTDFPREFEQISSLAPLRSSPHLLHDLLVKLDELVRLGRRRLEGEYVDRVVQSMRSSIDAAANIEKVTAGLKTMDSAQRDTALAVANDIFPYPFFAGRDLDGFFRLLADFQTLMLTLHKAIKFATAIPDTRRRKGRPSSPYLQTALVLINVWETVTAELSRGKSPNAIMKRVPMPKRLKVNDQRFPTKQASTEFIAIALRMINPRIKDAEVFTAIQRALTQRKKFQEFVRRKLSKYRVRLVKTPQRLK